MQRPCVLIVDDNLDLAENLAEILEEAGFSTRVFNDPEEATVEITPGQYAAALLDMRMPGMDGVELYRRLRAKDPAMPAIAMTAYARDEIVTAAMREGVSTVMAKPVDFGALLARITSITGGSTVLIVDDDVEQAQNLAEIMTLHGLSPRMVHRASEARDVARLLKPDVLVVDVRLPDADGAALVQELAEQRPGCIKLLISGFTPELSDVIRDALTQGTAFLGKPVDVPAMLALVKTGARREP